MVNASAACEHAFMPKHPKRPRDPAQLAKLVIDIATGEARDPVPDAVTPAQEFARQGGLKGGAVRAERLSAQRRQEIARAAAEKRWSKKKS
jgi:hypothetical protein